MILLFGRIPNGACKTVVYILELKIENWCLHHYSEQFWIGRRFHDVCFMSAFLKNVFGLLLPVATVALVIFSAPVLAVDKKATVVVVKNSISKNIRHPDVFQKHNSGYERHLRSSGILTAEEASSDGGVVARASPQGGSKPTVLEYGQASYYIRVNYRCSDNRKLTVHYIAKDDQEFVLLITAGEIPARLERTQSGSGVLYSDEVREWHTKANEGLLIKKGQSLKCFEQQTDQ